MTIQVDILTIRQDINLEQGVTANFLVLRLPTGRIIQALVDDEVVSDIVKIVASRGLTPPPVIPAQPAAQAAPAPPSGPPPDYAMHYDESDGQPIAVFGGNGAQAIAQIDNPLVSEPEPLPRPALRQQGGRSRAVQADEAGNPISRVAGGVDPGEFIATGDEPGEAGSL